jgi:RHS repeat-associated protein
MPTDIAFTGQHGNLEVGLLFYRARFYVPALGRFLSADTIVPNPSKPSDLNRYAYAANSPLSFIDPNGHQQRPPSTCGAICYTGTTGPYLVEGTPPVQPLTVGTTKSSTDTYVAPRPDDGMLLLYYVPGYVNLRREVVVVNPQVEGGLGSAGAEIRRVTELPLLGGGQAKQYDEVAGNDSAGVAVPILGKLGVGAEIAFRNPTGNQLEGDAAPSISAYLLCADVGIQPNQIMAGYINPIARTGQRYGLAWGMEHMQMMLTTRQGLAQAGGPELFGQRYGAPGAEWMDAYEQRRVGDMSGISWLRMLFRTNGYQIDER